jgi:hypothetical protein
MIPEVDCRVSWDNPVDVADIQLELAKNPWNAPPTSATCSQKEDIWSEAETSIIHRAMPVVQKEISALQKKQHRKMHLISDAVKETKTAYEEMPAVQTPMPPPTLASLKELFCQERRNSTASLVICSSPFPYNMQGIPALLSDNGVISLWVLCRGEKQGVHPKSS